MGWLLCDGREVSRTTYAVLYSAIGSTFGNGDGSTTFNLPDPRGRALVVAGTGTGLTARTNGQKFGTETHTLTVDEMPSHAHVVFGYPELASADKSPNKVIIDDDYDNSGTALQSATSLKGGDTAHNNVQPSFGAYLFIKY